MRTFQGAPRCAGYPRAGRCEATVEPQEDYCESCGKKLERDALERACRENDVPWDGEEKVCRHCGKPWQHHPCDRLRRRDDKRGAKCRHCNCNLPLSIHPAPKSWAKRA